MVASYDAHTIEVIVTPSASAFYAGETFSCTITFRNVHPPPTPSAGPTRAPSLAKSLGSSTRGHRSAISLGSEAFGGGDGRLPSTASVASAAARPLPPRKGLIGHDVEGDADRPPRPDRLAPHANGLYGQRRLPSEIGHKRASYSIALSSPDLLADLSAQNVAYDQRRLPSTLGRAPTIVEEEATPRLGPGGSPVARRYGRESPEASFASRPGSPEHSPKHAKSKSLVEAQTDALADAFADVDVANDPSPRASVDFYRQGQNESIDALWRDRVTDYTRGKRTVSGRTVASRRSSSMSSTAANHHPPYPYAPSSATLSRFPSLGHAYPASAPAWDPRFPQPGTQTLLWTFAQMQGTFEVDEQLVKPAEFIAVKRALFGGEYRHAPRTAASGLVGGGSLSVDDAAAGSATWRAWFWGTDQEYTDRGGAGSLEERRLRAMSDKSVPMLSMPPSILAVDLALEPGESKTYQYSLPLPADLPPTYRGKAIRFVYTLLVGSNRAPDALIGETQQSSRLVRIPIRLYNNVAVSGARPFYDLTNPIVWYRDEAATSSPDDPKIVTRQRRRSTGRAELEAYAGKLLGSTYTSPRTSQYGSRPPAATPSLDYAAVMGSPSLNGPPSSRPEMRPRTTSQGTTTSAHEGDMAEDEVGGCKGAVEVVSRNSQKASYEINKDGFSVAILVLVKTAFRLGETVHGVVMLNGGEARVIRMAARLETCELIETTISIRPAPAVRTATRRTHAEHHEATLDSARVPLALPIPSGGCPDFATSGVKLQWSLRLTFLVIPPPPPMEPEVPVNGLVKSATHTRRQSTATPAATATAAPPGNVHARSRSLAALGTPSSEAQAAITDPVAVSSGLHHLMPVSPMPTPGYTAYKALPDLSYSPVLFRSGDRPQGGPGEPGSTVLMPTRVEVVECSIPIKMYPSSTAYRPGISHFLV